MEVRTRFAPSPTGHLHIGGARTALFNYLFAKKHGGKFILRIEDTDLERSSIESEKVIIESLKWLGIEWDEGVDVGGPYGPYRSTERVDIYKKYVDVLFEKGYAYYCYCTEEELEAQRQELLAKGQMPRYLGKCRNLTEEQKRRFAQEGRKPTVRFKVPEGVKIVVHDLVRGDVEFMSDDIGDFVIVKSDGIPTYNFAVVIDDHLMKISHVIRGEEHLSNTPRQILIYNALGFELPQFAHVSLILGKDRTKMSKRHGSTWVEQYKDQGYLKEGLINFLALLGWSPPEDKEIFDMEYLIENFSLDRVSKNPAIFDIDKLNYINSQHIKLKSLDELTQMCIPYFVEAGYIKEDEAQSKFEWLKKIVKSVYEGLDYLSQIKDRVDIFFNNEVKIEEDEAKEVLKWEHVKDLINVFENKMTQLNDLSPEAIKLLFKEIQKETGYKGKNLFMPIRVVLTGKTHGPELVEIIEIVGKENILKRLEFFKTWYN